MIKDMRYNTPTYVLVNNSCRYVCYCDKKTTYGRTALLKTPGGNWVVANGVNFYSPMILCEVHGDWNHGHYFMEDKKKAIAYYEEVK